MKPTKNKFNLSNLDEKVLKTENERTNKKVEVSSLDKKKVLLGLSGGVDSTAAVLILKEKGFKVIGYYFSVLGENIEGLNKARKVANELNIELITEDVSKEFEEIVVGDFCDEFLAGRTPNPCVMCNPNIKFKKLINMANKIGAYHIATGHYARTKENDKGIFYIMKGKNDKKDQSYMLYRLDEEIIKRLIFPLGEEADKEEIRKFVKEKEISNWKDKDSQEICFLDSDKGYQKYLEEKGLTSEIGNFIDKNGKVLGKHKGISNYTIGQRKGLGIALGKPVFVTKINHQTKEVTLGDNQDLFTKVVESKDNVFVDKDYLFDEEKLLYAKIRYGAKPAPCYIKRLENGNVQASFLENERAATPGQSIVFYDGELLVGGGFIC